MARRRKRTLQAPELMEGRQLLSTFHPFARNTIDATTGAVTSPATPAEVRLAVHPQNLTPRKPSTIIGVTAAPTPGSNLQPAIIGAGDAASGTPLPFRRGVAFNRAHPFARGYARVSTANPISAKVTGLHGTTGPFAAANDLPGDLNGDGVVNLTDLRLFQSAYLTTPADAFYNPSADANKNKFVGQGDARFLMRNLPPLTPKVPLKVDLALAPGQYAAGTKYENSGGITRLTEVDVVGHTTPGSIVFADSGLGDFTFTGPAIATDANGMFTIHYTLDPKDRLKNTEYLVIDPYGQQTIRAFPILLIS